MLDIEEVWPILLKEAKHFCIKFEDAHLEVEELINEAWIHNPLVCPSNCKLRTKIQRDMLDYIRTRLQLRNKYQVRVFSNVMFKTYGVLDKQREVVEFNDLVDVLLERSNLRPLEKEIVLRCLVEGLSQKDTAQIVGRSPGYISSSLSRAKQRLKEVCIDLGVTNGTKYGCTA